jgi:hypothetical protein
MHLLGRHLSHSSILFEYFLEHNLFIKRTTTKLCVVGHTCNSSTQKAEAGGLRVASYLGYIIRPQQGEKRKKEPQARQGGSHLLSQALGR